MSNMSNITDDSINYNEETHIKYKLNQNTLYKWNISKRTGFYLIFNIIITILKERINNKIKLDELSILINKRYKENYNFILKKHKRAKSLYNFLKVEFDGIYNIIDIYLYNILYIEKNYLYLNNKIDINLNICDETNYFRDWYYINTDEIINI